MIQIALEARRGVRAGLATVFVSTAALLLSACGGSDGDRIGVATGQTPDPVVLDIPIGYVKRALPVDDNGALIEDDARDAIKFAPGADLFVRDRASPSAPERNVTGDITLGMGDVRGLAASYDGTRLVFSLREPLLENVDDEDQPKWNIWEYNLETDVLRRVITSNIVAEAGHDVNPVYLADDRIVFSSTRQRTMKAILLDEGKPQYDALTAARNEPAFLLHVMDNDGSDVEQISYNQSHDLAPTVLSNGRIAFQRWDDDGGNNAMHFYTINPDGTSLKLLYGALSHDTGTNGARIQFLQPQELPDGRILSLARDFVAPTLGGDLIAIDTNGFVENNQPVTANAGMAGPAQEAATSNAVSTDESFSRGGRYADAFPLFDGTGRLFISWTDCRLSVDDIIRPCTDTFLDDPAAIEAPPLYGLWIYVPEDGTQLPVVNPEEGIMFTDVVALQPRPFPPVLTTGLQGVDIDPNALIDDVGILHIRSVYDIAGEDTAPGGIAAVSDPARTTIDERPAAFVRILKVVSEADQDVVEVPRSAFGPLRALGMREVVGYAPVAPDGSVVTRVPANVAFQIEVLNAKGERRSGRHENWMQVRPGELLECNGCHVRSAGVSHGRDEVFASANPGAATTGQPFPNSNPAFFADFGETMALARARISCATDCRALIPDLDLVYEDVWTDPVAAGRPADEPFAARYADLETTPPVTQDCLQQWSARCRAVINYEEHIHPLWGLPRVTLADDGVTVLSDYTCTGCHNIVDEAAMAQVPASQLDLSDGASVESPDNFKSYRELFFNDNEQEVVDGALIDRLIEVGIDEETMLPIFETVRVQSPIRRLSALEATPFFDLFEPGASHAGYISAAEKKLLTEWVDIGAQYYNNQFAIAQD
ncbi:MAG: hypothetical protein AB8G16_03195 [Gammaproteobacteria bacterium]